MSVFKTAYDTTATQGFVLKKTEEGILESLIRGWITKVRPGDETVGFVDGAGSSNEIVPGFNHPLVVELNKELITVSDVRSVGKLDPMTGHFIARMGDEYKAIKLRTYLQAGWIAHGPSSLSTIGGLPMNLYANWISENIGKRFALDPQDQLTCTIFAAIFYMNLFSDSEEFTRGEIAGMAGNISRITNIKNTEVLDRIQHRAVIRNIDEYCEVCREYSNSTRLRDLNSATLIGVIGGTWWGPNNRELVAVALEHPPTWLTIIYEAITQRSFKNSALAKMLERSTYRRETENFVHRLATLPFVPTEAPKNSRDNPTPEHWSI